MNEFESNTNSNAKKWAKMLAAPQDTLVRAPSNTPFLASKTRFVRSIDIPYSSTNQGGFTVVQLPSATNSLGISGVPGTIPSAAADVTLESAVEVMKGVEGLNGIAPSLSKITGNVLGVNLGTTSPQNLQSVHANYTGYLGVRFNSPDPVGQITFTVSPTYYHDAKYFIRYFPCRADGSIVWSPVTSTKAPTSFVFTGATLGVCLQHVGSDGTPINDQKNLGLTWTIRFTGTVPVSNNELTLKLTSSELLEAGDVHLQRCTAMSLLVTNMAAPINAGGELVIARCPIQTVGVNTTQALMTAIKQLPEERYWRSGAIVDGGYAWWLPDDLNSYEPQPVMDNLPHDNVLVAAGTMSDASGYVRVIATWTFEFYTPVQLFARDYNCVYSDAHRALWYLLSQKPAVSANMGHIALISAVGSLAIEVFNFYQAHRKVIDPIARKGIQLTQQLYSDFTKGKPAPKQNRPASNPSGKAAGARAQGKPKQPNKGKP